MQIVSKICLALGAASLAVAVPGGPAIAIGEARQCKYMVPWQIEKPGYKWIWTCEEECVSWRFSDPTHKECLYQVPIDQ